ncbi:YceI family protein [soil metagenome]
MATYKIDPTHSEMKFKVKHLMITNVTGEFKTFDATMESDKEDFSDAKISFTADIDSINTNQEQRDTHLKSDDFFNAEKFPKMTFVSKELKHVSGSDYKLTGDLTIRDITKEFVLDVEFGGRMTDFYGQDKAGFELTGKINRSAFELKWSAVTEAGGVVVSDDVKLQLAAQMVKQ